jgi:Flp pilus assembly protein TadG
MQRKAKTRFWSNDSAATAALYALALPALVAVTGIGFDYARIASMDSELQNAADQAALAGATQLDQSPGSMQRAVNAARGGLVSNFTYFANDGAGTAVTVPDTNVYFYQTRAHAEADTDRLDRTDAVNNDPKAEYIRVVVATRTAEYALTPVVGAFSGDIIDAQAVAGVGAALCRSPPLMVCNPQETPGNLSFNPDNFKGFGLLAKGGSSGGFWSPGNFGYLDTIQGGGTGTPELRKAMGWDSPIGNCISKAANDSVDTSPGNKTDVADSLNTRFDIYNGDVSCPTGGKCPASINSVKDVMHPAGDGCSLTNAGGASKNGWQETSRKRYLPLSNSPLDLSRPENIPDSMGHPRDICHATATNRCSGGSFGDGVWDIDAYFATHYIKSDGTRWFKADFTEVGDIPDVQPKFTTSSTRYEVYLWEIENSQKTITDTSGRTTVVLGQRTSGTLTSYGAPKCSPLKTYGGVGIVPSVTVADRRRLSLAVVNCVAEGVRGNSKSVPVQEFMDVFLVQPSIDRNYTSKDEIYLEIIGRTKSGSAGETAGTVVRRDVPYLIK